MKISCKYSDIKSVVPWHILVITPLNSDSTHLWYVRIQIQRSMCVLVSMHVCVCVFWVEASFEEQPVSQYVEPEAEPEPEYEGGIHTYTHTLSAPIICFCCVVLSHLIFILPSQPLICVSQSAGCQHHLVGKVCCYRRQKMISLCLVVFYVLDVQAVSNDYEDVVEQRQPQYEAVVEPDAIYEEPPQVRHSLPELTPSEL